MTYAQMFSDLATQIGATHRRAYVVVDEAQDLSVAQLRFLVGIGSKTV